MSSLSARLLEDLKQAMKAKDEVTLTVLRALKSALKYAAIEAGGVSVEPDEAAEAAVLRKQIKQRRDSVESFTKGGRPDLAEKELAEIEVLKRYLPKEPSAEELAAMIDAAIQELGATSKKDMGAVIKAVQQRAGGTADNRVLAQEAQKRLP